MEFNEFKTLAAAAAREAGIGDYELYYVSEESTDVSMFNGDLPHGMARAERCGMDAAHRLCEQPKPVCVWQRQHLHSQGVGFHHELVQL